jgi:hypothetical protein
MNRSKNTERNTLEKGGEPCPRHLRKIVVAASFRT